MHRLLEKYSNHDSDKVVGKNSAFSSLQLFSREVEKLQRIYRPLPSPENPPQPSTFLSTLTRKLSPFQLLLKVYTAGAIVRFLLFSACLRAQIDCKLYRYDLLMDAFNARRTYDQYLAACSAAFGAFVLYIYHLNYFSLSWPLAEELWRIVVSSKETNMKLQKVQQDQQQVVADVDDQENKVKEDGKPSKKSLSAEKRNGLQLFFKYEAPIHAILLVLFGLVLLSRQLQFYRFALIRRYSPLQTGILLLDGSMMIILNITLLKCAIFEEYTVLLFCGEYLRLFRENTAKLVRLKIQGQRSSSVFVVGVSSGGLFQLFRRHFEYTKAVEYFNRVKVSRVMFGYIAAVLPLNIYLLQAVIFKRANAVSSNYKVSVAFQTFILFTSTLPMSHIYEAVRRPAKLMDRFQILASGSSVLGSANQRKGVHRGVLAVKFGILNFYEYLTDDASGKCFSLGSMAAIKSTNLLKVLVKIVNCELKRPQVS